MSYLVLLGWMACVTIWMWATIGITKHVMKAHRDEDEVKKLTTDIEILFSQLIQESNLLQAAQDQIKKLEAEKPKAGLTPRTPSVS